MDRAWLRFAQQLEYRDPVPLLRYLLKLEAQIAMSSTTDKVKNLRTNSLKEFREIREAAIFCYGMAQRLGNKIFVGRGESQDYDFVASWLVGDTQHLAPVQIKEVVPTSLNPKATVQATVNALTKYVDSEDLVVAIHLNQSTSFDPTQLILPHLKIAELWVFGALEPDRSTWGLWGNLLETHTMTRYQYPV